MRGVLLAWCLVCTPAMADVISEAAEQVELTVYRERSVLTSDMLDDEGAGGIAMLAELRTVEIPAGTSVIQFRGVAAAIVPQTAQLEGLPASIVETNFDYNLLAPGSLIANSLGRRVRLIRTDRLTGAVTERQGTLQSGPEGVVIDFDGETEALNCSGVYERLVFDDVPASLAGTPTLSMTIRAPQAGRYQVRLSYLTLGLDWSADYVARIHPDGKRLDLGAWVTLVNREATRFTDVKANVVAGYLARQEEETRAPTAAIPTRRDQCWPIGQFRRLRRLLSQLERTPSSGVNSDAVSAEQVVVTGSYIVQAYELGDYKLYTVPFPTSVAPRQIKQVRLLEQKNVRFERLYEYRVDERDLSDGTPVHRPDVLLRLENKPGSGLGVPLPAGTLSLLQTDAGGGQVLAGESALPDIPIGLPFEIRHGLGSDLWIMPRVVEETYTGKGGADTERRSLEIKIGNDKATAVRLDIIHEPLVSEGFRVVRASRRHRMENGQPRWSIRLRPGQRAELRYTIEEERAQ